MGCSSSAAAADPEKAQFHDQYLLGKKLGSGAFGQVRIAMPRKGGPECAVKIVDVRARDVDGEPVDKPDKALLYETRQEVLVWKALGTDDHCVNIIASFFHKNIFYMVMEKCACSLMDKLEADATISESDFLLMLREMMQGIRHLHSVDVVHRDIKPENYLLGGTKGTTIKLCDFGFAVKMPPKGHLTDECGTPPYMAPEMLCRAGYGKSADVWSFGVTAFLMVHCDFPYSPPQPTVATMKKAIRTNSPPIKFVREDEDAVFSREFVGRATLFLQALLRRAPLRRPSADEVLDMPFLQEKGGKWESESSVATCSAPLTPAVRLARQASMQVQRAECPVVQRRLDELLGLLQDKSTQDAKHFFSESAGEEMGYVKSLQPADVQQSTPSRLEVPAEDRVRQRRADARHRTHSGVVSPDYKAQMEQMAREAQERHERQKQQHQLQQPPQPQAVGLSVPDAGETGGSLRQLANASDSHLPAKQVVDDVCASTRPPSSGSSNADAAPGPGSVLPGMVASPRPPVAVEEEVI